MGIITVVASVGLYLHDRSDPDIGSDVNVSKSADGESPSIRISSVYLSEVAMSVPAFFELSIQPQLAPAFGTELILDFGRSEVDVCGYTPMRYVENVETTDKNYRRFKIAQLGKDEKFYVRCIISAPFFSQVIIQGGNINIAKSLTFAEYQASVSGPSIGFWPGLGYFFVIFFTAMLCLKIIGFLFDS